MYSFDLSHSRLPISKLDHYNSLTIPKRTRTMEGTYEVTLVVGLSTIVAQKVHRVPRCDVFRVVTHELLHAIPQSRDSLIILVQTKREAVLLVVLLHEAERVVGN